MSRLPSKKSNSPSLGSKLIFLRDHLSCDRFERAQQPPLDSTAPTTVATALRSGADKPRPAWDPFASDWKEPTAAVRRPRAVAPTVASLTGCGVKIVISASADRMPSTARRTTLTNPRHAPAPPAPGNKPSAPPHDPRIIGYLGAGGSRVLKLRKHEARVRRNRAFFVAVLCAVVLLIIWTLFAK